MRYAVALGIILTISGMPTFAAAGDDGARQLAGQAERSAWHKNREAAISEAKTAESSCMRGARAMSENRACANQYAVNIDHLLQDTYQSDLRMVPEQRADIQQAKIQAENAWSQYRDAQCAVVRITMAGGNAADMEEQSCRTSLAIERIRSLSPQ